VARDGCAVALTLGYVVLTPLGSADPAAGSARGQYLDGELQIYG